METARRWIYPLCALLLTCGLLIAPAEFSPPPNLASFGVTPTVPTAYTVVATGEVAGSTTALQCPAVTSKMVRFKAHDDNVGNVNLGASTSMTIKDGTTDTTSGLILTPGQDTGWIPAASVSLFWHRETNATDDFTYMALN